MLYQLSYRPMRPQIYRVGGMAGDGGGIGENIQDMSPHFSVSLTVIGDRATVCEVAGLTAPGSQKGPS
jgi:hypothetical protein